MDKQPKNLRKYLRRQERQQERTLRSYQKSYKSKIQYQGTKILFIMIVVFSIIGLSVYNVFPEYIYFSLNGVIYKYMYHTFFTALFVSSYNFIDVFFLFIMLFFLYFMVRAIESIHGTVFLIKLYLISGFFSAVFYILLRLLFTPIYALNSNTVPLTIGLAWGGILGLLSYSIFPMMNKKITAFMYFLPIRMSGRSFLFIIIFFRLIPVLFYVWYLPYYAILFLPELGGILGAYIVYRFQYLKS